MHDTLIIFLHQNALMQPSWAVLDSTGKVDAYAIHDSSEGLAAIAENKHVLVMVPGEDVLLTAVTLPKISAARVQKALPYALEEGLIDDIEMLHFAQGPWDDDDQLTVAIVAKEKMQSWLALLASWQIKPDDLIPVIFALPYAAANWQIYMTETAMLRYGKYKGICSDHASMQALAALAYQEVEIKPEQITINSFCGTTLNLDLPCKVEVKQKKGDAWIAEVAQMLKANDAISLLQGKYTVKKRRLGNVTYFNKALVAIGATAIALLFLYPVISYFILHQHIETLDMDIKRIYGKHFPQAKAIIAPKLRMQDKLQKVTGLTNQDKFLLLLTHIGLGMNKVSGITLKRVDYQDNQLTLDLTVHDSDALSAFIDYLKSQNLQVKQQNVNLIKNQVNASLLVE